MMQHSGGGADHRLPYDADAAYSDLKSLATRSVAEPIWSFSRTISETGLGTFQDALPLSESKSFEDAGTQTCLDDVRHYAEFGTQTRSLSHGALSSNARPNPRSPFLMPVANLGRLPAPSPSS